MGRKKPIRTAVIGLGRAGWSIHVAAIRPRTDFVLTAVVDPDDARLKEARDEFGCETYPTLKDCLRHSDAELVVVATQSKDHAPMSIQALRSGRHAMTEKPMAVNSREADRMIAAAKKAKRLVTVHQNYRVSPLFLHLKEVLAKGWIGTPFQIRCTISGGFTRRNDWQTLMKYGGGTINNTGTHFLDQALQLAGGGPVDWVKSDLQHRVYAGDAEDHARLWVKMANGLLVDMEVSGASAIKQPMWWMLGTCGSLVCDGQTTQVRYFDPKKVKPRRVVDSHQVSHRSYNVGETLPWKEKTMPVKSRTTVDFYGRLYASIREGAPLLVDPADIRLMTHVIERAKRGTGF